MIRTGAWSRQTKSPNGIGITRVREHLMRTALPQVKYNPMGECRPLVLLDRQTAALRIERDLRTRPRLALDGRRAAIIL